MTTNPDGPLTWDQIKQWRREQRNALLERRIDAPREARKKWAASVERYVREILGRMSPQAIGFYLPFKGDEPHRDIGLCWRTSSPRRDLLTELAEVLQRTMKQIMGSKAAA